MPAPDLIAPPCSLPRLQLSCRRTASSLRLSISDADRLPVRRSIRQLGRTRNLCVAGPASSSFEHPWATLLGAHGLQLAIVAVIANELAGCAPGRVHVRSDHTSCHCVGG